MSSAIYWRALFVSGAASASTARVARFSSPNKKKNYVSSVLMEDCEAKPIDLVGGFLAKKPYNLPSWASHLNPIPSHIYSLGHLPTPIHKWNVPNLPDNTEIWIKRDDLSGMQLSGNKVRKLEFLLADAVAHGADCVITVGGIQSNHCRATAVAARYLNIDCYLILRTSKTLVDKDPGLTGNLLVERLVGAKVELVSKEEYANIGSVPPGVSPVYGKFQESGLPAMLEKSVGDRSPEAVQDQIGHKVREDCKRAEALADLLKERLISEGRKPYVIPVGGSNSLGSWGYIEAIREIEQQTKCSFGGVYFDDIAVACGRKMFNWSRPEGMPRSEPNEEAIWTMIDGHDPHGTADMADRLEQHEEMLRGRSVYGEFFVRSSLLPHSELDPSVYEDPAEWVTTIKLQCGDYNPLESSIAQVSSGMCDVLEPAADIVEQVGHSRLLSHRQLQPTTPEWPRDSPVGQLSKPARGYVPWARYVLRAHKSVLKKAGIY
ncbi:hypothetical protein M5K25_012650 [Dendrobium thyrsiflorum]|uniref:Tryptophan synthase beta chain-like PALP domain-containing protein n=1 Tax=Dendrobium thyrsiflorum TaxID=117978 RepID=A0ABD0V4F1_DENTH